MKTFAGSLLALILPLALFAQSYNPQPINFGFVKVGQTSPVMTSTLTNTGTDTLRFPGGSSMAGSSAFQWVNDNCGGNPRPPGATCVLQYRFSPKQVGVLTGSNVVMTNHGAFLVNFVGAGQDTTTTPSAVLSNKLIVWPDNLQPSLGTPPRAFYAILRDSTGALVPGVHSTWRSSDTSIATVDPFGVATYLRSGNVTLTATYKNLSATSLVQIGISQQVQVPIFDIPVWTGFYEFWPRDATGKRVSHIQVFVLTP